MVHRHVWSRIALYAALVGMLLFCVPAIAMADAIQGETVVTLGDALTEAQQQQLLAEMNVDEDVPIEYVSNAEEHHYLGDYISANIIGSNAISSARITLAEEGHGIQVNTNNITWVTEDMYANAMLTAGIADADVYVTAPIAVSGTAGLTGIIKAFEAAADIEIDEEQKQVANQEIVTTAELGDSIGTEEASALITRLKELLADADLETDEDYRQFILDVAAELNITLSDDDVDALMHLLKRLQGLNIDWEQVGNQLEHIRDNLGDILSSEETQNFLQRVMDFIVELFNTIRASFAGNNSN